MFANPKFTLDRWCDILGYLTLYDVGRLDSALSNLEARKPFLEAMSTMGPLCSVLFSWTPNLAEILRWMKCRSMDHSLLTITTLPDFIDGRMAARAIQYMAQMKEVVVFQQQQQQPHPSTMDLQRQRSGRFLAALWRADMCHRQALACQHRCKKCSMNHCHEFKIIFDHAVRCKNSQCETPRCIGTRTLLSHYSKCQDAQCQVCQETRLSIRRQHRYDDISQYLYLVKEDQILQELLG
jgi:hypothetical protein